jgi:hypothetical protein
MWSKTSKHSLVAGAIEAFVAAGSLVLSSTFVIALAFPQSGYVQTAGHLPIAATSKVNVAKSSSGVERNTLALNRTEIHPHAKTYNGQ